MLHPRVSFHPSQRRGSSVEALPAPECLPLACASPSPASSRRLPLAFCVMFAAGGLMLVGLLLLALRWSVARDAELAGVTLALASWSWAGLRASATALRAIALRHRLLFIVALSAAYLFKQTFAVPGSVLLNALAGVALGSELGVPLCVLLCACGSLCGYLLSREFGGGLVGRCGWERRLALLRARVERARAGGRRERSSLALTLISLRLFPGTPHWAINILAPHAGVSLGIFWVTAAVGMAPAIAITVRGGELIAITDWADVASSGTMVALAGGALAVATLALLLARGAGAGGARGGGSGESEEATAHRGGDRVGEGLHDLERGGGGAAWAGARRREC